ncbi:DUF485 domain-containing protein [Variovorax ginsengisoli]|uniref:DUF485 domain-containing protein n=1 Tax=Variovorax ginsengisoli TaxID=363844 RepID=A0ABT8SIA9_9BURK|nr:DUF485 domain-containing protein [Variovorax ginsengisoli]MDN8618106.1 DUF485 domain-containing protein [Variovorax ginsengisoli]MDO1537276.1 DUF485 domain-containing protein [Variovorax ginsengisoli]
MESLTETSVRLITANPRFIALVNARARFRWALSATIVGLFFGFVLMVGFARKFLETRLGDGPFPLGFYLAIGMVLSVVGLTGIYVHRASSLFGRMTDELVEEMGL